MSPTLDSALYDLSRAGNLDGIENLKQGLGIGAALLSVRGVIGATGMLCPRFGRIRPLGGRRGGTISARAEAGDPYQASQNQNLAFGHGG